MKIEYGLSEFHSIVSLVYDGVENLQSWKTLMSQLSAATGSRDACLLIASRSVRGVHHLITNNEDPVATGQIHVDSVMTVNPYLDVHLPSPISADEMMPAGEFLRTDLYQRFLQPLNIRHLLSCDALRSDSMCAVLTLERNEDQAAFGDREKGLLALLAPHIGRAIRLREQQQHGSYMWRLFEDVMAKLTIACVVLDGRGRIASLNRHARELLGNSEWLRIQGDRLSCSAALDGRSLTRAIDLALAAHRNRCRSQRGIALQLGSGPGGGIFDIVVRPLVRDELLESGEQPAVMIYINDVRESAIDLDPEILMGMYGLTRCESRVAALLASGTGLEEMTQSLEVSINTVKTHLRGVYEKLGINRQSQVVARLNQSVARLL